MSSEQDVRAACLRDLVQELRRYTETRAAANPNITAIEGFLILRSDLPRTASYRLFQPALCVTIRGAKWATFGDRRYEYRAGQAMVVTLDTPSQGAVFKASPREPFLGFVLALNLAVLHELSEQMPLSSAAGATAAGAPGVCVVDLCAEALDCLKRALRLLKTPEAIPMIYPAIERELLYWLLAGPGGHQVLRATRSLYRENRLLSTVHELKARYREQVRIDELAALAGMSPATFYRQFKATTAMSPMQYQKQLRLLEARRLMLASGATVEAAATQVGYESSSQFSREYARMFGRPPRRDVHALAAAFDLSANSQG